MAIERYRSTGIGPPVVSTLITYAVWFFLGIVGGHRFITGRIGSGLAMLGLHVAGWLTFLIGIGYVFWAIGGLWWLIDALLIPGWMRER